MKNITQTRKFMAVLLTLIVVQVLLLLLWESSFPVFFVLLSIEAFLVLLVFWSDSRAVSRHDQLIQRIARASTRPEINQLKWQLQERDVKNYNSLLSTMNTSVHIQSSLQKDVQCLTQNIDSIEKALEGLAAGNVEIFLNTVERELRTIRQGLHQIETSPKFSRAQVSIEQLRQDQKALRTQFEQVKILLNETIVLVDALTLSSRF